MYILKFRLINNHPWLETYISPTNVICFRNKIIIIQKRSQAIKIIWACLH